MNDGHGVAGAVGRFDVSLPLGMVELKKGRTRLAVRALSKPGEQVVDLKAVRLTRVE